uniref:Uncharacterized protein n=1 Tax=Caenorhabditis japonica TaxID=281687 RepID=A0A8R1IF20_CAEJA
MRSYHQQSDKNQVRIDQDKDRRLRPAPFGRGLERNLQGVDTSKPILPRQVVRTRSLTSTQTRDYGGWWNTYQVLSEPAGD